MQRSHGEIYTLEPQVGEVVLQQMIVRECDPRARHVQNTLGVHTTIVKLSDAPVQGTWPSLGNGR